MPSADITVIKKGDPPCWADLPDPQVHVPDMEMKVAIIEGGMASGRTSIAIRVEIGGDVVIMETSLAILASIVVAARGALPDQFEGGPLEVPWRT